jgi:tetratricopeptide (TPR) repeat protein
LSAEAQAVLERGQEAAPETPELMELDQGIRKAVEERAALEKGVAEYAAEREKNEKNAEILEQWAFACLQLARDAETAALYEKLTMLDPKSITGWEGWGQALLRMEKWAEAVAVAQKGLAANPDTEVLTMLLREAEDRRKAGVEAPERLAKAEAAAKAAPEDPAAQLAWIKALQENNRADEALDQARLASEAAPDNADLEKVTLELENQLAKAAWIERMKKEAGKAD